MKPAFTDALFLLECLTLLFHLTKDIKVYVHLFSGFTNIQVIKNFEYYQIIYNYQFKIKIKQYQVPGIKEIQISSSAFTNPSKIPSFFSQQPLSYPETQTNRGQKARQVCFLVSVVSLLWKDVSFQILTTLYRPVYLRQLYSSKSTPQGLIATCKSMRNFSAKFYFLVYSWIRLVRVDSF